MIGWHLFRRTSCNTQICRQILYLNFNFRFLKYGSYSDSDYDDLSSVIVVDEVKEIIVIQTMLLEKYNWMGMKRLKCSQLMMKLSWMELSQLEERDINGMMGIKSHADRGGGKFCMSILAQIIFLFDVHCLEISRL